MSKVTRLHRQPKKVVRKRVAPELASTPIFDEHGRYIGSVIDRPHGFEAGMASGASLGLYNAFEHAAHAILAERR